MEEPSEVPKVPGELNDEQAAALVIDILGRDYLLEHQAQIQRPWWQRPDDSVETVVQKTATSVVNILLDNYGDLTPDAIQKHCGYVKARILLHENPDVIDKLWENTTRK